MTVVQDVLSAHALCTQFIAHGRSSARIFSEFRRRDIDVLVCVKVFFFGYCIIVQRNFQDGKKI